jgi:hypothetical protein
MTVEERVEFCAWLYTAESALVNAQRTKVALDGRRLLRRLRDMFMTADYTQEAGAAKREISGFIEELVDSANDGQSLVMDDSINSTIDSLTKAVDVLRPYV